MDDREVVKKIDKIVIDPLVGKTMKRTMIGAAGKTYGGLLLARAVMVNGDIDYFEIQGAFFTMPMLEKPPWIFQCRDHPSVIYKVSAGGAIAGSRQSR